LEDRIVSIEGREVRLTHLDKPFWPEGLTKAHLIKYYAEIAPYILPHVRNRPVVMKRYPDGIAGAEFYQKEIPSYAPAWIKTHPVQHSGKVVPYIICNDTATLVWLANQACVEVHAWLARIENLACPDIAVMDLDPAEGATFDDVLEIALFVRKALDEFKLKSFPKTSGASGLHLFIPIQPVYSRGIVTKVMKYIAGLVAGVVPAKASTGRKVDLRTGKVYLDYLQNGRGKTMAFQYGLRPLPGAPVSTPLEWGEVGKGRIRPADFNIESIFHRLKEKGDLYADVLTLRQSLDELVKMA
jgi:bifunctional non-homologous end joining protein LigD